MGKMIGSIILLYAIVMFLTFIVEVMVGIPMELSLSALLLITVVLIGHRIYQPTGKDE